MKSPAETAANPIETLFGAGATPDVLPNVELLRDVVALIDDDPRTESTLDAYRSDVAAFERFAVSQGIDPDGRPASPVHVAAWVASMNRAGNKAATIERRVRGLGAAHRAQGFADPTTHPVVTVMLSKLRKAAPAQKQAHALTPSELVRMIGTLDLNTVAGLRDRAMLVVGWTCALRVSELVGLRRRDVLIAGDRVVVSIVGAKHRDKGHVDRVAAPCDPNGVLCPSAALTDYLEAVGDGGKDDPLFRAVTKHGTFRSSPMSARGFADRIRQIADAAAVIGDDGAVVSPHSLRRGWATAAAHAGVAARVIKQGGRWKSTASAERYVDAVGGDVESIAATLAVVTGVRYSEALVDVS